MENICICCDRNSWVTIPYNTQFNYMKCNNCGYYIQDRLNDAFKGDFFEIEQEKYYGDHSIVFQQEPNIIEQEIIEERIQVINKFLKTRSSVLEVGPGGGDVLQKLIANGHAVTAIEHSEHLGKRLVSLKANVIISEFEQFNAHDLKEKFDAFCSFHVIEHVNDVLQHLTKAHELVKSGGLAFIATPNANSWQNVLPFTLSPNLDTAHFQLFSKTALKSLLEKSGWEVIFVKTPEYPFSWLRVFTKIFRRILKKDESSTAGDYAQNLSTAKINIYKMFKLSSFPLRKLQLFLNRGNELFIVAQKVK